MTSLVILASALAPTGIAVRLRPGPSHVLRAQVPIGDPDDDDAGIGEDDDDEDDEDDEEEPWQVEPAGEPSD